MSIARDEGSLLSDALTDMQLFAGKDGPREAGLPLRRKPPQFALTYDRVHQYLEADGALVVSCLDLQRGSPAGADTRLPVGLLTLRLLACTRRGGCFATLWRGCEGCVVQRLVANQASCSYGLQNISLAAGKGHGAQFMRGSLCAGVQVMPEIKKFGFRAKFRPRNRPAV